MVLVDTVNRISAHIIFNNRAFHEKEVKYIFAKKHDYMK